MASTVKQQARDVIDQLPDDIGWDDLMYELYVRQKIAQGIEDAARGHVFSHEDVKKKFLSS